MRKLRNHVCINSMIQYKKKFEDINEVIESRESKKNRQWLKEKRSKRQTIIDKILHRKLKIGQHDSTKNWGNVVYSELKEY